MSMQLRVMPIGPGTRGTVESFPPPNPPDRNRIFTRLTGRPYSKRFFEILKARRKLPCEMAQNFCRFFLGVDQQQRLFLCSTVSKIVVKIFQVIIVYTYRYSIQCTYTFIAVYLCVKEKTCTKP